MKKVDNMSNHYKKGTLFLTFVLFFISSSSGSNEITKSDVSAFYSTLIELKDSNSFVCDGSQENTIMKLENVIEISDKLKLSIGDTKHSKCDLYIIDAVVEDLFDKLKKAQDSRNDSECKYGEYLKSCNISKVTFHSVLENRVTESFKACLENSITAQGLNPQKKPETDEFDLSQLESAVSFFNENGTINPSNIQKFKRLTEVLEEQVINLLVLQMKNPQLVGDTISTCDLQVLSMDVTSLKNEMKSHTLCDENKECNPEKEKIILEYISSIRNELSKNDLSKCVKNYTDSK